LPKYEGGIYSATVTEAYESNDNRWYKLEFPKEIVNKYGVPYYWVNVNGENLEIQWFDKVASRIPQAAWLKVKGFDNKCEVRKLGRWIKPCDMVGSPLICATDYGVRSKNGEIISLDSMLVAPYGRRLLDFETNPTGEDLYFNLYNNVFNTNFPMWYGDDTRFRFIIKNKTKRSKKR
jgi:hypothetical protein